MRISFRVLVVSLAFAALQFVGGGTLATSQSASSGQVTGDHCEKLAALAIPNASITVANTALRISDNVFFISN